MAYNTHISVAAWNSGLDAMFDRLNGGYLEIYGGGVQPATPDQSSAGSTLLATLQLGNPAFSAATAGTKTANPIAAVPSGVSGTAVWFRAYLSDCVTAVDDGSCGLSISDMILNTLTLGAGVNFSIVSWTISMPAAQ